MENNQDLPVEIKDGTSSPQMDSDKSDENVNEEEPTKPGADDTKTRASDKLSSNENYEDEKTNNSHSPDIYTGNQEAESQYGDIQHSQGNIDDKSRPENKLSEHLKPDLGADGTSVAQDVSDSIDDNNCCEPCQYRKVTKIAKKYCTECDERYCGECATNHTVQKQTKNHELTEFQQKTADPKGIECEPCLNKGTSSTATHRCDECEEAMCDDCKDNHLSQKRNRNHIVKPLTDGVDCDPCSSSGIIIAAVSYCTDCDVPEAFCETCAQQHTAQKRFRGHKMSTDISVQLMKGLQKQSKGDNTGATVAETVTGDTVDNENDVLIQCEPCEFQDIIVKASHFCAECEEKYCDDCTKRHKAHPTSKDHDMVDLETIEPPQKICDPCAFSGDDKTASYYCAECDEYLCQECQRNHKSLKQTRGHNVSEIYNFLTCHSCLSIGQQIPAHAFCEDCEDELLCEPCSKRHLSTKKSKDHKLSEDMLQYKLRMKKLKKEESDTPAMEQANEEGKRPGRPYTADIVHSNSLVLQWDELQLGENDAYQVMLKDVKGKWRTFRSTTEKSKIGIDGLQPNTAYIFRVRVVNDEEGTEGPFSPESEPIQTGESPACAMMKISPLVYNGEIPVHELPLQEDKKARNDWAKTRKMFLGTKDRNPFAKNVMIVGATGSGKSTLVNAMANYIMGVTWEDPFRFTLVNVETDEQQIAGDQAHSQTQWITCYTIYQTVSNRLPYTINLIDTPGFGDTRGIEHDQRIVKQIKDLFCSKGDQGVTTIDAICFILKAPDARLTPTQSYIFESILSLFGNDIKDNICTLVTFADGQKPPVLASLEAMEHKTLPCEQYFTFNNSALYVKNTPDAGVQAPFFWEMGMCSCKAFFDHLETLPSRSLLLTAEVLGQRERLENTVEHLYQEVDNGLSKIGVLEQEINIFTRYRRQIRENKDFIYDVTENVQEIIELTGNRQYTTNCLTCNFTCHESCVYANDDDKAKCCAMRNGACTECPGNCHWTQHKNTPYIIKLVPKKVSKKYSEKQKIYEDATKMSLSQEQILSEMCKDIETLEFAISDRMSHIAKCNNRLKEIALRPDPMTVAQYLELMIESERREKKPGFQNRIDVLEKCKKKAQYGKSVQVFSDRLQYTRQNLHDTMNQPGEESSTSGKILEGLKNLGKKLINKIKV